MKILSVRERTLDLASATANAAISFGTMTASAVVVEVETGKGRFNGLGFSSIGRYGHGGLIRERFIPRLMNATPSQFLAPDGVFSIARAWDVMMRDEKEGGHGERSGAVGVLELALWDALAKSRGLPLWALLRDTFGHAGDSGPPAGHTAIYASGGHYHAGSDGIARLRNEVRRGLDQGYAWFKLKIGGAEEAADLARVEASIAAAGSAGKIAADCNCAYDGKGTQTVLSSLDRLALRWIEEPVQPLNYEGLANVAKTIDTPVATGENIFSAADTKNLLRYGGLRAGKDILQMDILLSYGITELMRMITIAEGLGWSRRSFVPHAGHQAALHACGGLGLGAHEAAVASGPFGGVCTQTKVANGMAVLGDGPGAGIEHKPALFQYFDGLIG